MSGEREMISMRGCSGGFAGSGWLKRLISFGVIDIEILDIILKFMFFAKKKLTAKSLCQCSD